METGLITDSMLDRRQFTLAAVLAMLGGVTITIAGCGSSSPSAPSSGTTSASGDKTGAISANHGHQAIITAAQLSAGGGVVLHIQGAATHDHTVSLSGTEIGQIAGGQQVTKESSSAGHTHNVTFN
jgi:hypothetical protein